MSHLGGLTLNEADLPGQPGIRFMVATQPTELQTKAFALLDLPPGPRVYNRLTVQMARIANSRANPTPSMPVKFRSGEFLP